MLKTATFDSLLDYLVIDSDGYIFTLEGKSYRLKEMD